MIPVLLISWVALIAVSYRLAIIVLVKTKHL